MFDDLHDPDPPRPGSQQLLAVTARAKQLRIRRYTVAGVACAAVLGLGGGALALTAGDESARIAPASDPTPTTPPPTIPPSSPSTVPPTLSQSTSSAATTVVPTIVGSTSSAAEPTAPSTTPTTIAPTTTTTTPPTTASTAPPVVTPTMPATTILVTDPPTPPPTSPATTAPETSSSTSSPCAGPPAGVLAVDGGDAVHVRSDGTVEMVVTADEIGKPARRVIEAPDGTIWLEVGGLGVDRSVGTFADGTFTAMRSGVVTLGAVGSLRGSSVAAIVDDTRPTPNAEEYGSVDLLDVNGETLLSIGPVNRPTSGVYSVGLGGDVIALGKSSDLAEAFEYYGANGSALGLFDPNESARYAQPPLFISPVASTDVSELVWLEGPDTSNSSPSYPVGRWEVVVGDSRTGAERIRLPIGEAAEYFLSSDFDGRWLAVDFGRGDPGTVPEPSRSVIIDLAAPQPSAVEVCSDATTVSLRRQS